METDEKLPDYNPKNVCPKCGKEYPIWQLLFDSIEKRWKVGHNFCPAVGENYEIVQLCIECKVTDKPRQSSSIFGPRKQSVS